MAILNEKFYESLDKKIDSIPSKEDAELFIKQVFEPVQNQINATKEKCFEPALSNLKAYIAEAEAISKAYQIPSDPMDILSWASLVVKVFEKRIELMKKQIQPYLLQYNAAKDVVNGMPAEVTKLKAHFEKRMNEKGWSVSVPTITYPTLPPLPEIPSILVEE